MILSFRWLVAALKNYTDFHSGLRQTPGLMETYRKEHHALMVNRTRTFMIVGVALYLFCHIPDRMVYPQIADFFLLIRLSVAALIVGAVAVIHTTNFGHRHAPKVFFAVLCVADLGITLMTAHLSGWSSVYFVGLMIVQMGVSMSIPWHPRMCALYVSVSFFGYVAVNRLYHPFSTEMVIPLAFLFCNVTFAFFSSLASELTRLKELSARLEIQRSHEALKQQLKAARDIQRSLLPPFDQKFGDIEVQTLYQPCDELSGDFFDTIVGKDWLYVYVADVTSHGVASAQVTYLIKEIFSQILIAHPDLELPTLFERVRSSYADHHLEYDVGLQLLRVHKRTKMMENLRTNAPNPPLLGNGNGAAAIATPVCESISSEIADNSFPPEIRRTQLHASQSVYLYTDGASEFVTHKGHEFGDRRLSKAIEIHHHGDWRLSLLTSLKNEKRGTGFSDDVTILRLKILTDESSSGAA